jgi:hypothetical protein
MASAPSGAPNRSHRVNQPLQSISAHAVGSIRRRSVACRRQRHLPCEFRLANAVLRLVPSEWLLCVDYGSCVGRNRSLIKLSSHAGYGAVADITKCSFARMRDTSHATGHAPYGAQGRTRGRWPAAQTIHLSISRQIGASVPEVHQLRSVTAALFGRRRLSRRKFSYRSLGAPAAMRVYRVATRR